MATDKQKEEPKSRKPRLIRRNLQMEELPTFTKWLTSFGHSTSCNDANAKSKLLNANRPAILRTSVVVLDSLEDAGGKVVVGDVPKKDRVQAVDDSISARAGCCCWQSSKSTRRECALKFHLSLRKRKVVVNASEAEVVVAAVSNLHKEEEEAVVAVSDGLNEDECGCSCSPMFQICGRRKGTVTSDLQKGEGAVTDVPKVATTSGSDLAKEREVVVGPPDLRKEEESGCCCRRWKCLPPFQICRRRKVVAGKVEVIADVPKVEETMASKDSPNVDVPDSHKEGSGCSCFRCVPKFRICRRRKNGDSDVPNPGS